MGGGGKGEKGKDRSSDTSYEAIKSGQDTVVAQTRIVAVEVVRSSQILDIISR